MTAAATARPPSIERDVVDRAGRHGPVRIVVVDGLHAPAWSTDPLPPGLRCGVAADRAPSVRLLLADRTELTEPVHVVHVATGAATAHPALVLDVGRGSHLDLIETFLSTSAAASTESSTTVHLAPGASTTIHRVQDEDPGADHRGRVHVIQQEGSHSEVTVLARGGSVSELSTVVELSEPAASCRFTGLLVPRPGARHDDTVTVVHAASRCTSDLRVRAIVPQGARTASVGHVIVRPGTVGNDARQRTDSLLLDRTAQADSRPWLEIFADDVRANHGSATGRLDEDALFYLRSRGIPAAEARAVLVGAFARAIIDGVQPPSLRARIGAWLGAEVDR